MAGTIAGQTTTSEAAVHPFANVTITDPNADTYEGLLTITIGGVGSVLNGDGIHDVGGGVYVLGGASPWQSTAQLEALTFTPNAGAPGSTEMDPRSGTA